MAPASSSIRGRPTRSRWPFARRRRCTPKIASSRRGRRSPAPSRRPARGSRAVAGEAPKGPRALGPGPSAADLEGQQWAIQRRIEDIFAKLGEKYGDLTGRVEVKVRPDTSFSHIGGLQEAKLAIRGFVTALTDPELYKQWGITPPKGVLIYGPPGTGKSLLARALATEAGAIFYHLKLMNLTSKFGPNTGEVIQEILGVAKAQGRGVVFLDEADAPS